MLRPQACRWFELAVARDDLAQVLQALAAAGTVELQAFAAAPPHAAPLVVDGADRALASFHQLAHAWGAHWPAIDPDATRPLAEPATALREALARVEAWCADAAPQVGAVERLTVQARALDDAGRLLEMLPAAFDDTSLLAAAAAARGSEPAPVSSRIVVESPAAPPLPAQPPGLLRLVLPGADETFVVLAGRRADLDAADESFAARKARRVEWPAGLPADPRAARSELAARRAASQAQRADLARTLQALAAQHRLADALADIRVVEWLLEQGGALAASERLAWVTGWTTCADPQRLCAWLNRARLRAVVWFPPPAAGAVAPSLLVNPRWAHAAETLTRALGPLGRDEADPSTVVAVVAPLLFGFMFGDVGQGAVLLLAGLLLRRRWPLLRLLVPGGAAAMVFGALFGSVFTVEGSIPALWLHPLHAPVQLLATAVAAGAALLLGGLALQALQAHWRGAGASWWMHDAGLVVAWLSLLAALLEPSAAFGALAGALWFVFGAMTAAARAAGRSGAAVATTALAQFVEHLLQLLVNTVSFARVGAFALAHAGLSVTVHELALAAGGLAYWIVLLFGNLLILALEGLVVAIQTTRLLLFEFFARFLQGTGREFRPLPPPLRLPAAPRPPTPDLSGTLQ